MARKLLFAIIIILVISAFLSCVGPDGNSYQKYWWAGSLGYLYDTNPSTPSTIYSDVYFPTDAGSFYMEYVAFDGSAWYLYYTITVKEGFFFIFPGDDAWFEIGLYSSGPTVYEWDSARNMAISKNEEQLQQASSDINRVQTPLSTGKTKSKILGVEERQYEYGSIKLEYGKILN